MVTVGECDASLSSFSLIQKMVCANSKAYKFQPISMIESNAGLRALLHKMHVLRSFNVTSHMTLSVPLQHTHTHSLSLSLSETELSCVASGCPTPAACSTDLVQLASQTHSQIDRCHDALPSTSFPDSKRRTTSRVTKRPAQQGNRLKASQLKGSSAQFFPLALLGPDPPLNQHPKS